MAGERKHLRDAVAHQPGADDGDTRFGHDLPRRVAAVGVKDVAGVEIRRLGGKEQQRSGEILGLAQAALGHAGEETLAHGLRPLGVLIHPGGERRPKHGRPQRVDGDAGVAPFTAQGFGDAIYCRLGCAISGIAGRMAEQSARGGSEDDLTALALSQHLLAGGARHQPRLGDVGVHDIEEIFRLLIDDLRHFVEAGGHHQNVEAAELVDRGLDDLFAVCLRIRPQRDDLGLGAERFAFGRDLFQLIDLAAGQHHIGAGANVVLTGSKVDELKKVAAECEALGAKTEIVALRPNSEANCEKIVKAAVDKFGRLDILVVASGLNKVAKIVDQKPEDFLDVMDANVTQSWLMARAAGKQMLAQGQGGKVILTSSARGLLGHPAGYTAYCASKSAVDGITKALGCEWGESGITVNALGPTVFRSPLTAWMYEDTERAQTVRKGFLARVPKGRLGEPEDLAGPLLFLASKASDFYTGHILYADGGYTAG